MDPRETGRRYDAIASIWDSNRLASMHGVRFLEKAIARGIDAEIVGNMHGVEFTYSSLSEIALMELVQRGGCIPVLVERDQYPLHHLVFLAVKAKPIAA